MPSLAEEYRQWRDSLTGPERRVAGWESEDRKRCYMGKIMLLFRRYARLECGHRLRVVTARDYGRTDICYPCAQCADNGGAS